MFLVDISPDITMYNLLKSQGYDPAYALSEFIDNALQAHLSNNKTQEEIEPLEVKLYFYSKDYREAELKNSIVIEDNGPGITKKKFINAMRPARPAAAKGLSEFGIGMKASAVWFTDNWKLETKPSSEKFKYILNFNLLSLINNHEHKINTKEISDEGKSGTKITLYNLRRQISKATFESIINDLEEIYQKFTRKEAPTLKLKAFFDLEEHDLSFSKEYEVLNKPIYKKIKQKLYAIGDDKQWKVNLSFSFEGVPIKGFICLRDPGSYTDNPGLVMFRYDRVIQGLSSKKFMPLKLYKSHNKHEAQRVYGEFIANDLPVTYTKDKFEIDEEAFGTELAKIKEVQDLLKQSSTYRVDGRTNEEIIRIKNEDEIHSASPSSSQVQNPTGTNPSQVQSPTGTNPSQVQNPTDTNPSQVQSPTDTNPSQVQNPTDTNPSQVQNPTGTNPSQVQNPTGTNPFPVQDPNEKNHTDGSNTADTTKPVPFDDVEVKKELIQPEMLKTSFQTNEYCSCLINQINWIFLNKKTYKTIILIALRNLVENYLDYTYSQAFPSGTATNFENKLNEMINSVSEKKVFTNFVSSIHPYLNHSSHGYQTQKNIFDLNFSEEPIKRLVSALHLSAHKGNNIVNPDSFFPAYVQQYNLLLEFLYCIAIYQRSITPTATLT
ncbi:ATP-binding protein [Acinetobacter nosocomialis]